MKVRFQREERNFIKMINYDFEGKENAITAEHLKNGEICKVVGYGQSMTPILKIWSTCNLQTSDKRYATKEK